MPSMNVIARSKWFLCHNQMVNAARLPHRTDGRASISISTIGAASRLDPEEQRQQDQSGLGFNDGVGAVSRPASDGTPNSAESLHGACRLQGMACG